MIESRILYIDLKSSIEKAYAKVRFEDVTFSDVLVDGELTTIATVNQDFGERLYEFQQPTDEATILGFIENERAKL